MFGRPVVQTSVCRCTSGSVRIPTILASVGGESADTNQKAPDHMPILDTEAGYIQNNNSPATRPSTRFNTAGELVKLFSGCC